jgi:hypothetical protein
MHLDIYIYSLPDCFLRPQRPFLMHIYIFRHLCICMYAHEYTYIHIYVYTYIYFHIHAYISIYFFIYILYLNTYTYIYRCLYIYIYTYVYTYIHIHMSMHIWSTWLFFAATEALFNAFTALSLFPVVCWYICALIYILWSICTYIYIYAWIYKKYAYTYIHVHRYKPLSTGTPPNANDIHEKNGTMNSSFLANAKCLIGQVADTKNPSINTFYIGIYVYNKSTWLWVMKRMES